MVGLDGGARLPHVVWDAEEGGGIAHQNRKDRGWLLLEGRWVRMVQCVVQNGMGKVGGRGGGSTTAEKVWKEGIWEMGHRAKARAKQFCT